MYGSEYNNYSHERLTSDCLVHSKRYKITNVKDENSAINEVNCEGLNGCYQLNSI